MALFTGRTFGAIEKIAATQSVAVVSALDPAMRGYQTGITAFGNEEWRNETVGFDVNAAVLDAIKASASRELKLVNGQSVKLIPDSKAVNDSREALSDEITSKLAQLGREWHTDVIVAIFSGFVADSIGHGPMVLGGFGIYKKATLRTVYWVPLFAVFDCKTGRFIGSGHELDAQRLPDLDWQKTWGDFSLVQQHAIQREWEALIKASLPSWLFELGLRDTPVAGFKRSVASKLLVPGADVRPSITQGNQLEIPPGLTPDQAHRAVLAGFKDQAWTITADAGDTVAGSLRDGKKEARCTVTFQGPAISLTQDGDEIQSDGTRATKEYSRWQNSLREAIVSRLMDAGVKPIVPEGNQLEMPAGLSLAAARRAVVSGFKDREWQVTAETEAQVTGVYRKGKKEAVCTVNLSAQAILLAPDGYEIQSDGKRTSTEYRRWQNNLKESICEELLKAQKEIAH